MKLVARIYVLLLAPWWCGAQHLSPLPNSPLPPEFQKKLDEIRQAPASRWLELFTKAAIPYLHDELWLVAQEMDGRLRLRPKPSVEIRMDVAEDAPFAQGNTVVYPALFLAQAQLSSFLLSHDLYVDIGHSFPVLDPILQRPYAVGLVMKQLDLSSVNLTSPVFLGLLRSLTCYGRDDACNGYQAISWSATLEFALAHEYGHIAAGDSEGKEFAYSLDKEIAADDFALNVLKTFGPDMFEDDSRRDFFGLGPVALLAIHRGKMPAALRGDIDARIEALLKSFPEESRDKWDTLTRSEKASGMSTVQIAWNETPSRIAIDGVIYSPREISGKMLRVTSDRHEIVAFRPDGVAWASRYLVSGKNPATIRLEFEPFVSATPDTSGELADLTKRRKWGDILLRTGTQQLQPRSPEVAFAFFEALRGMRLGTLIPAVAPSQQPAGTQRRTLERWIREARPLSSWEP